MCVLSFDLFGTDRSVQYLRNEIMNGDLKRNAYQTVLLINSTFCKLRIHKGKMKATHTDTISSVRMCGWRLETKPFFMHHAAVEMLC